MGFFFRKRQDIDNAVEEFRNTDGAVLLDVRTPDEYRGGHIPGSVNLPLSMIDQVREIVPDPDTPVFVYCRTGARSGTAVRWMKKSGYTNVRNIGGIHDYNGKCVR